MMDSEEDNTVSDVGEEVKSASNVGENEMTESEEIKLNTEESDVEGQEGTAEDKTEPTSEANEWEDEMGTVESEATEPTSEKGEMESTDEITEDEEIKPLSTEGEEESENIMTEGEDFKHTSEEGDKEDTDISERGEFEQDSARGMAEVQEPEPGAGEGVEEGKDEMVEEEGFKPGEEDMKEREEFEPGIVQRLPTIQELVEEVIRRGTGEYGEYQITFHKGKPDSIDGVEDEARPVERQSTVQELLEEIIRRGTVVKGELPYSTESERRTPKRQPTIHELLEEIIRRGTGEERQQVIHELLEEIIRRGTGEERQQTIQELLEEIIRRGTGVGFKFEDDELGEDEFRLSFVYLMTFTDRFRDGTRELIVRGNDLYLRKGRRLRDCDMRIVCEFLHQNPFVVSVDLAYNEITDKGLGIIADFLQTHDSVRRLNVMGNNIGPEGIKKLADLGDKFPLESLRVNGNKIGVEGGKSLAAILDYNVRLRQLDMGQTDQTLSSLAYIWTALYNNTTLQIIDLSRPLGLFMHALDSAHWAESLGLALKYNKTLQELHLQKSDLIDHDIELLLLGLKYNNTLLLLDLGCNRLGNHSMELLGSYLKQRPALIALILDHNHIGDLGARCLSFTMPFSKIQLLDLSYNKVTDVGLLEILTTVKKTVRLRAFYIWGNPITHKSCPLLRRLLRGGILQSEWVDFELYTVDGVDYLAYQNVDRSRHIYYCVGDFAFPQPRPLPKPRSAMPPTALLLPRIPFSAKYIPFSPAHPRLKGGPPYLRRHPEENPSPDKSPRMTSTLSRRSLARFGSTTGTSPPRERDASIQADLE